MSFRGLFVGIDRYKSTLVRRLTCASRDATALASLFGDTFGDGGVLLLDEHANKENIVRQLEELTHCDEEDVVVLSFSGHGSPTHELVSYDANPLKLKETCISLEELGTWFARIPARNLICFLDCCFSGELGSKVLTSEVAPRDHTSTDGLIHQISGEGRMIFTASASDQPAWENQKLGHGIMTGLLLKALQGAEEVLEAGKISLLQLFAFVTRQVVATAASFGHIQEPTWKGNVKGVLTWPPFVPGDRYRAAFPELVRAKVSADITSLEGYGFSKDLLATWAQFIPSLNQLQQDAINDYGLLDGNNLIVSAPTSSGKTMIAELAALKGALARKRTFILLPLKALVNDKYEQFRRVYGDFGIETIRATGEISDDVPDLMRGRYDICLLTYEKFSALVLGNPYLLEDIASVVIDEVQMISDKNRGLNLEFILTYLKRRAQQGTSVQIIALSAVVGDTNGLEAWLDARLLRREDRPVPLNEGTLSGDGTYHYLDAQGREMAVRGFIQPLYRKGSSQDLVIPLVRKLVGEGKQVIVFREIPGETVGCAKYLGGDLGLPSAEKALAELPPGDPSNSSHDLRQALHGGVAFHNGNLERYERSVIEVNFRSRDSQIRALAATTTLAMGVNTPAEAAVIVGLMHPQDVPYSVAEYKNMVGRAGRLGFATEGFSFLIALNPHEEQRLWRGYVLAHPEDLTSRFLDHGTDLRSIIVRVLAALEHTAREGLTADDIKGFLSASFGAFRARYETPDWQWEPGAIAQAIAELLGAGLLEDADAGKLRLTALGKFCGEAGVEVHSAIRIIEVARGMDSSAINDPTLITLTQMTLELDGIHFPLNKKGAEKERRHWSGELLGQGAAAAVNFLHHDAQSVEQTAKRAKKAVACLYWIAGTPMNNIEQALMQFDRNKDAAGPVRSIANRTADLLEVVGRIVGFVHAGTNFSDRLAKLNTRLQLGIGSAMAEIGKITGGQFTRAEYRLLEEHGLDSLERFREATDEELTECFEFDQPAKLKFIRQISAPPESGLEITPLPPYQP